MFNSSKIYNNRFQAHVLSLGALLVRDGNI